MNPGFPSCEPNLFDTKFNCIDFHVRPTDLVNSGIEKSSDVIYDTQLNALTSQ